MILVYLYRCESLIIVLLVLKLLKKGSSCFLLRMIKILMSCLIIMSLVMHIIEAADINWSSSHIRFRLCSSLLGGFRACLECLLGQVNSKSTEIILVSKGKLLLFL